MSDMAYCVVMAVLVLAFIGVIWWNFKQIK